MREKKKEGGGRELVVQSLPRLPHPRKTPRGGISCYLMPAKLSSKISLTTPDLLKTLSPQKLLYKQIKCMQCVLYVCCVGCCCNCDVSAHAQAGRQAGKCMEIITALTTHGVMMWVFLRLFSSSANKVFTCGLSCFDNFWPSTPCATPENLHITRSRPEASSLAINNRTRYIAKQRAGS